MSLILVEELVFEKQRRGLELGVLSAAATASFAVHSAIRGNPYTISNDNVFDLSAFPSTLYDWAIGILFGFAGALLAAIYFAFGRLIKTIRIFLSRKTQCIPFSARIIGRCVIGGLLYGTLNYIFPLNVSSGNYQLGVVALAAQSPETIDSLLLMSSVAIRLLSYWIVCEAGFVGGMFFPLFLVGEMTGASIIRWTGVSPALALSCMLTTFLAAFVPGPITAIILPFYIFNVGQGFLFPIFVAVAVA